MKTRKSHLKNRVWQNLLFKTRKKEIHMQGSITLNELGIFIVFALIVVAGGYAIMTLRNINGFVKEATVLLQKNKEHVNHIIPNINVISEDTAKITKELNKSVDEAAEAIRTISHETTDTVLTINETADHLAEYAIVIGEIVKAILNVFSANKKTS
jgi:methyl-accepting chemotaxis protein